ncbi:hypothetical protein DDE18_21630 [Nocardioides gansuensis]|uniref:S9 family peptidase n=1 Tax=Nocardioides gansuensis TaxID=2138300 RepID=A0A2T8F4V4_9ACTN|nr:hypothetical protein DDE18_21630 [Nocardioides gansuensis]
MTRTPGAESGFDWSPDGRRLAFTHWPGPYREGIDVWTIRPDGSGLRMVMGTPELDLTPAWSPGGRRLALYSDGPDPFGSAPQPGLWTVGA